VSTLKAENAALHAMLDGEEARWATLTRKYVAAVSLDRENLRSRLLAVMPTNSDEINAVWLAYETEHPVAPDAPAVLRASTQEGR
jgi:hypothetical protein